MRTNILRHVAVALGLTMCVAPAQADDYTSPEKWSHFNAPVRDLSDEVFRTISTDAKVATKAKTAVKNSAKAVRSAGKAVAKKSVSVMPGRTQTTSQVNHGCAPCQSTPVITHAPSVGQIVPQPTAIVHQPAATTCNHAGYSRTKRYRGKIGQHLHGVRSNVSGALGGLRSSQPSSGINRNYGGFNLMFLALGENGGDRNLMVYDADGSSAITVGDLDPSDSVGFDFHVGRYLDCGLYGADFRYMVFNPGMQERLHPGIAGAYRPAMIGWNNALTNGGASSMYADFDAAVAMRARRDLKVQSIEATLNSFGWMGARRLGTPCNAGLGGARHAWGNGLYGGAGKAQTRGGCRVQVVTSHGFRWFQLEDSLELAADNGTTAGYQADDTYYNVDVENNLFGYQFGSRLTYCLSKRMQLNVGGKMGLYGNDVNIRQRMGTLTTAAYLTASGTDDIDTDESDTVFSALGELDLGLGYRLNNAWTVEGGYRLIAACGVATAPGSILNDFSSMAAVEAIDADDCLILHGGYVGLAYNW
ncbi:MAG: BBP7 family outer membrane beta-barrel protein [Pirellulaceae bacterium]|nr:BBP7 family outer membrane beta-barrel protein [Pirellulaceae bacterium]